MKKFFSILLIALSLAFNAQVGIGTISPDASSILDLTSTDKGFLLPRLTEDQRNLINNPAKGLSIFNLTSNAIETNFGTPSNPVWIVMASLEPIVESFNCGNVVFSVPTAADATAYTGTMTVPYNNGNGAPYAPETSLKSINVEGLTAVLVAGTLANGAGGNLVYNITGTPSGSGNASFVINFGTQTCAVNLPVASTPGSISSLTCASASLLPATVWQSVAYSGQLSIPYTDGNGAAYSAGSPIASTGVTGLTATLIAGTLANGNGNLTFLVTGTPSANGTANFALTAFGIPCSKDVTVATQTATVSTLNCAGRTFTPATSIGNVAYSGVVTVPYTGGNGASYATGTPIASTGVSGLTATLVGSTLNNGSGTLTFNVSGTPTAGGTANFLLSFGGQNCSFTFTVSPPLVVINCAGATVSDAFYRSTVFTGTITIPYTGGDGSSYAGGTVVSSTGTTGLTATLQAGTFAASGNLVYNVTGTPAASGSSPTFNVSFNGGTCSAVFDILPLRANAIINCAVANSLSPTYAVYGQTYSGSKTIGFSAGNTGGHYPAQSIASTGVLGLTATLAAGTFTYYSGSIQYAISGTPDRAGDAVFAVNVLGGSCTFYVPVAPVIDVPNIVYTPGAAYDGRSETGVVKIPYQAGIAGGQYAASSVTLNSGFFLSWDIAAGTYAATGTLDVNWSLFAYNGPTNETFLLKSAVDGVTVVNVPITMNRIGVQANPISLSCTGTNSPATFTAGVPYVGTRTITYSGSAAGRYQRASSFASQGVTGLTASYGQNTTTSGNNQPLQLTISGTPSAAGTALFDIEFGGIWCTFSVTVN